MSSREYNIQGTTINTTWQHLCFPEFNHEYTRIGKVGGIYPKKYLDCYDQIKNFEVRNDDVWICTFPKAGTTWTQEMVWCLMNGLDYEAAKINLDIRSPYFEVELNRTIKSDKNSSDHDLEQIRFENFALLESMDTPRCIKCHLHFSLLPTQLIEGSTKAKIIYVMRNPKDTCVSFYNDFRIIEGYRGTLDQFTQHFVDDNLFWSPYWDHVREYWENRDRKDILILRYEEMKKDLPTVIKKVASFLCKQYSSEEVNRLAEHLSFENIKDNPAVNKEGLINGIKKIHGISHNDRFIRKGKVGSWKEELSPESVAKLDKWISEKGIHGLFDNA